MYRCGVCNSIAPASQRRLQVVLQRTVSGCRPARSEIDKEIPVCRECHHVLEAGVNLRELSILVHNVDDDRR